MSTEHSYGNGQHPVEPPVGVKLTSLDIELTERCQNACCHCYNNLPAADITAKARELSTEEWQELLRQAAELETLSVKFTGGEPLIRDDFPDLYLFARRLGLKVCLFTNARGITPELAQIFAKFPPLEPIEISVYGMHEDTYESVTRVPGSYREFRHGVELLEQYHIPFVVKGIALPANRDDMDALEAWASSLPAQQASPAPHTLFLFLRSRRDSDENNRLIQQLRPTPAEYLALLTRHPDLYHQECQCSFARSSRPTARLFNCGILHNGCIDAYGSFQACTLLRMPSTTCETKNKSLREAVQTVRTRLSEMQATNPQYLDRCARCPLRGFCGQCPAKSWIENGTLDTPVEYLCQVTHQQARYLGLLNDGEFAWEITDWSVRVEHFLKGAIYA